MRVRPLISICWLFLPVLAHAGDNSCLDQLRDKLARGEISVSPKIVELGRLQTTSLSSLPRLDEEWDVTSKKPDFKSLEELDYSYTLKTADRIFEISYSISGSSEVQFHYNHEIKIFKTNKIPVADEATDYSVTNDCRLAESDRTLVTDGISIRRHNTIRISQSETGLGQPGPTSTVYRPLDLITNTTKFDVKRLADFRALGLEGKTIDGLSDDGQARMKLDIGTLTTQQRVDPQVGAVVTFNQIKVGFSIEGSLSGTMLYYESTASDYKYIVTKMPSLNQTTYKQSVSQQVFNSSHPEYQPEFAQHVTGFTKSDFEGAAVTMRLSNVNSFVPYENFSEYGSLSPQGDGTWIVALQTLSPPASIDPWNAPVAPADKRFLARTLYVHPEATASIADAIKSQLGGLNRLQASVKIIQAVTQRIKYDFDQLNLDMVQVLSTEQILANDKGVCQHFAGLFVAIARELGIPAREVLGLYLDEKGADWHAWVEVELSDGVWWPLEPQIVSDRLPARHYFPTTVSELYEVNNNVQTLQVSMALAALQSSLANASFAAVNQAAANSGREIAN